MLSYVVLAVFVCNAAANDFVSNTFDEPIPYYYHNPIPDVTFSHFNPSFYYSPPEAYHQKEPIQIPRAAIAHLSKGDITGNITFRQINDRQVSVEGIILGLGPGLYGFHIHEKGDLTGGCASAGGHFNPHKRNHGAPTATERHVGDLGNVQFDADHIARINYIDDQISLYGQHNILGRAVVLHDGKDDLGLGKDPTSLTTGNAGGRAACAVIGIL